MRISAPIKRQFTEKHNLDFEKSLTASDYKENFRLQMIQWSESVRKSDPDVFLRQDIEDKNAKDVPVWILADARRMTDVKFFQKPEFESVTKHFIRIKAEDEIREKRGYIFTPGVDDVESECGLDDFTDWTLVINNDDLSDTEIIQLFEPILNECSNC